MIRDNRYNKLKRDQEGNFYGQPASLIWKKDWNRGNPFDLSLQTLDSMRTKAAVLFPHSIIANLCCSDVSDSELIMFFRNAAG